MKINFNGQEYDDLKSMPPEIKEQYLQVIQILGDKNHNGIPDMIERGGVGNFQQKIVVNGKEYDSVNEMSADVRELYEKIQSMPLSSAKTEIDVRTIGDTKFLAPLGNQLFSLTANSTSGAWKTVVIFAVLLFITIVLWASGIKFSDIFLR